MEAFEPDAFYLMLANSLVAFPKARESIDELYQLRKLRYYEVAKENKYYDSDLMKNKPLELEVSMKRAYGILLCSQDDEQLQDKIIVEIYRIYPPIKKQSERFSMHGSCSRRASTSRRT